MIRQIVETAAGRRVDAPLPLPAGVSVRRGAWIPVLGGRLSRMNGPAAAVTLGRTIIVHPSAHLTERLLRHELAHVRQWRRRPFAFPLQYLWNHIRYGYRENPYEIEAREAETAP